MTDKLLEYYTNALNLDANYELIHEGVGHLEGGHSGRYPWGSGDRPRQSEEQSHSKSKLHTAVKAKTDKYKTYKERKKISKIVAKSRRKEREYRKKYENIAIKEKAKDIGNVSNNNKNSLTSQPEQNKHEEPKNTSLDPRAFDSDTRVLIKKKVKDLSNSELQTVIDRMKLEQTYRAVRDNDKSRAFIVKGRERVGHALEEAGVEVLKKTATNAATYAIGKAIEKSTGVDVLNVNSTYRQDSRKLIGKGLNSLSDFDISKLESRYKNINDVKKHADASEKLSDSTIRSYASMINNGKMKLSDLDGLTSQDIHDVKARLKVLADLEN